MRGKDLWCEETKTTVKIIGHSRSTTTLLRHDVSVFQLSDKALDLVKDPNGGNATIPPLEGRHSRGRGPLVPGARPREEKFGVSFLVKFRHSGAAELNQKLELLSS